MIENSHIFDVAMSNITINFELSSKPNKRGKYPIILRLTEDKQHKRCTTSVELSRSSDWDSKKQLVRSTADYSEQLNEDLEDIRHQALRVCKELREEGSLSASAVLRRMKETAKVHYLLEFFAERKAELEEQRKFGSLKKYGDTYNKMSAYLEQMKAKDMLLSEVDTKFVEGFERYLLSVPNSRDSEGKMCLSENSICKHKKVLRAVLNLAVDKGLLSKNPMDGMVIKETATMTRHLSDSELAKLSRAKFERGCGMDNARNLYLFSIYTAGMRLGDALMLRWSNIVSKHGGVNGTDMRLNYIMTKNGKFVDLILVKEAQDIINQYRKPTTKETDFIFPYLDGSADYAKYKTYQDIQKMPRELHKKLFNAINSKEASVNKGLKKAADMLGLDPFSFHSARRDFGRLAYDAGVKSLQIQDLLQHENLNTTERYMRALDTSATDSALEQTFSAANKERRGKVLVKELMSLGFGKKDIRKLFDEVKKGL